MGAESHAGLIEAIQRFLDDAVCAWERSHDDPRALAEVEERSRATGSSMQAWAEYLAALPACVEANALARKASLAAGYLLPEPAGRPLDADALVSAGLVDTVMHPPADLQVVASDLAGYLAGPPVDIWDYVLIDAIDAIGALQDPIPVVDGWELVTPSADELFMLLPLPSTASHDYDRPLDPFDPDDYGGLAMLRRVNRDAAPQRGIAVHLDCRESPAPDHPERKLWQPLTALSLYDNPLGLKLYDHTLALSLNGNPILRVWAWYRIEPRRRTDKLFEAVPRTPDGEMDIERLLTGAFDLELAPMLRFLEDLSPLLTAALSTQAENKAQKKAKEKAADQLRRCAEHFLTASDAHREGKVSPLQNADAVLHYAIA